MSPTFKSLYVRNYRIYAVGAFVSNIGTWMQRVAQDWLILQLTGSGTALGITTGLQLLPALLLSPIAGVVADRYPKRQILRLTQLAMALPAAVLGILAVTGTVQAWHIYAIAFVFGVGAAFDAPARQSFVVEMVGGDDLANALGLNSASFNSARMIGPAFAGVMIAALGSGVMATGWVILLNALSYLAVYISLNRLDGKQLYPAPLASRGKGAIREGVRYVRSRPDLILILASVFFVGTFGLNFQMTSALMATEVFDKGASEYGILGSIMAIGSLAGALTAARNPRPRAGIVVLAGVAFGLIEALAGLMPGYLTFALISPFLGFSALTMMTSANSAIQMTTGPSMRGRVSALYVMIFLGGTPFGAPLIGWIGEEYGARWTLILGGLASVVGIAISALVFARMQGLKRPRFRTVRAYTAKAIT
ncbi:MAG: MFS transporter [Propionibacteriales bacterium]|nr:MFS transporter [Propionibacteriales bacterium]